MLDIMGGSRSMMKNVIVIVDTKKKKERPEGSVNGEQRIEKS